MLSNTQSYSKIPLILTCDEEGGRVNRLMSTVDHNLNSAAMNTYSASKIKKNV